MKPNAGAASTVWGLAVLGNVDATVKLRESDGTLIQDLSADGYGVGPVEEDGFTWILDQIRSPFVDGSSIIHATKDTGVLNFTVRVEGADWAEVTERRVALQGWLDEFAYKVEVYADDVSVTYQAGPADMTAEPLTGPVVNNKGRQFAVSVPVQPNPAITGLG